MTPYSDEPLKVGEIVFYVVAVILVLVVPGVSIYSALVALAIVASAMGGPYPRWVGGTCILAFTLLLAEDRFELAWRTWQAASLAETPLGEAAEHAGGGPVRLQGTAPAEPGLVLRGQTLALQVVRLGHYDSKATTDHLRPALLRLREDGAEVRVRTAGADLDLPKETVRGQVHRSELEDEVRREIADGWTLVPPDRSSRPVHVHTFRPGTPVGVIGRVVMEKGEPVVRGSPRETAGRRITRVLFSGLNVLRDEDDDGWTPIRVRADTVEWLVMAVGEDRDVTGPLRRRALGLAGVGVLVLVFLAYPVAVLLRGRRR